MPGERAEHVVEEADAGCDLSPAGAIQAELDLDRGLQGLAADRRPARAHVRSPLKIGQLDIDARSACQDHQGTIWASAVTTMSVPPRALISGMTRGRSARGTAALRAKP